MKSCLSVHGSFCEAGLNETSWLLVAASRRTPAAKPSPCSSRQSEKRFYPIMKRWKDVLFFGSLNSY